VAVKQQSRRARLREKIEKHITIDPETGCWLWQMVKPGNYGSLTLDGDRIPAHRAAWEAFRPTPPGSLWVLHKCDNTPCCNPDHLYLGTIKENGRDHDIRIHRHRIMGLHLRLAELYESRREWSLVVKHLAIFLDMHKPVDRWTDTVVAAKERIEKVRLWSDK
jgi:hypothetical protein